jgi:preprotein translocase subunit SecE
MASDPKPKRRIVKNPESFRQKAAKASEQAEKPTKRKKAGGLIKKVFNLVLLPFRAIGKRLGKYKFFRAIGYIVWPRYFRNSVQELKLVTWPNWKQSRRLTWAVLVFAIVFGVIVALVDFVLDKVFRKILLG